jgi:DNA-binding beta-propeller fold protein YncE
MTDLEMIRVLLDEAPPSAEVVAEGRQRIATGSVRSRQPSVHRPRRRRSLWLAPAAAAVGVTLAVGLAVVLGSRVHLGEQAGDAAGRPQPVYVFNWDTGTLTPISPVTGALGRPVKVGPGERRIRLYGQQGRRPSIQQNLILPHGKTDYVVYLTTSGAEVLRAVDLATGAAGRPIPLGPGAGEMVMAPDGKTAYVLYLSRPGGETAVRPVSLVTGTVGRPIPLGIAWGGQMAITPDGRTVYVASAHSGAVWPISTATNTRGRPIRIREASSIVFTSHGRTAWVLGVGSGSGQTATPISTATNRRGTPIHVGTRYDQVEFTPNGKTAYDLALPREVTPISTATGRAGKPIKLLGATGMAVTPDSKMVYVVDDNGNGSVVPISTATNTAGIPIRVSGYRGYPGPGNIVISPDGRTAYAFTDNVGPHKQIVTPISIPANTPGRAITVIARGISIVVPGDQVVLTDNGIVGGGAATAPSPA